MLNVGGTPIGFEWLASSQIRNHTRGGGGDDDAYCSQRFRSYDPSSGTYMGYDGRRHSCP